MPRKAPFLAVLLLASLAAAQDWSQSFEVKGSPEVVLKTNDGHITVRTWNQPRVEARLIATGYKSSDYEVRPRQTGDRVEVEIHKRQDIFRWDWGNRTFRLEVTMPAKGSLEADTRDGHVDLSGIAGKVQVRTGDGHIRGRDLQGELKLETRDGHISLASLRGSLSARTGDGHMTVEGRFENLDLETGDGHVSVKVEPGSVMRSGWNVRTGDGRISVELPSGFNGELDARTNDGRVHTNFRDQGSGIRDREHRSSYRGKLGEGGRTFSLRSRDGSITLSQRG
jgi:hypothetical protein